MRILCSVWTLIYNCGSQTDILFAELSFSRLLISQTRASYGNTEVSKVTTYSDELLPRDNFKWYMAALTMA